LTAEAAFLLGSSADAPEASTRPAASRLMAVRMTATPDGRGRRVRGGLLQDLAGGRPSDEPEDFANIVRRNRGPRGCPRSPNDVGEVFRSASLKRPSVWCTTDRSPGRRTTAPMHEASS